MTVLLVVGFFPAAASAQSEEEEATRFLTLMDQYMALADRWVELAQSQERAVYMALEGLVEVHQTRGDTQKAIDAIQELLQKDLSLPIRNLLRFKLRDLYLEQGRPKEALAILEALLEENAVAAR